METSGRPAGGGVSLRPAVFRERELLWNLDVRGAANGGHEQAEGEGGYRISMASPGADPRPEALNRHFGRRISYGSGDTTFSSEAVS